jgi:hypothetical protein
MPQTHGGWVQIFHGKFVVREHEEEIGKYGGHGTNLHLGDDPTQGFCDGDGFIECPGEQGHVRDGS